MISSAIKKYSLPLTVLAVLAATYAAPYLVPTNPDSSVFRNGTFGFLLLLAAAYPAYIAFKRHNLRTLIYGCGFALFFSFFLGLGSELIFYDGLLPGMGSLLRRFAVPCLVTPLLGAICSHVFLIPLKLNGSSRIQLPYLFYFLLFAFAYGTVMLAFFPGIINYDFEGEIAQYITGDYLASHPIFHSMLTGVLYQLGEMLFGSVTAGAAMYSVVQLLLLAAMYAWCCCFVQKRVPLFATLLMAACMALLPFHGVLAISTIKDALFTGLCAMLCMTLWEIAENPELFLHGRKKAIRFLLICLFMSLLRHNAIFAVLPSIIAFIALGSKQRKKIIVLCISTMLLCVTLPRSLEMLTGAKEILSSELMSIPCQQLMRTAARAKDLTEEEYSEISVWFSDAIHRYRPHSADPAKGGNFDLERYTEHPEEYWSLYVKYAERYPRIYVEAFLANCAGIWYPDDTTHAHTMDSEEWDFVYVKTGNIVPEILGEVNAHSYLPKLRSLIRRSTHHAYHENIPVFSLLFRPAFYVYTLLILTLLLAYRHERRWILCTLPIWGIILSLLFSACILVRYAYPFMTAVPMYLLLILFAPRKTE